MKSRIIMAVITAAFLACICTMPMSAMVPSMFGWTGWAACPQGTTIDVSKRPLAERSGYRVVVTCYDQAGQAFEANQTLGLIALFGIVFLGMLVTSVILMVFMRGKGYRSFRQPIKTPFL